MNILGTYTWNTKTYYLQIIFISLVGKQLFSFYMVICGWNILENIHTLILVLLPASSTRTDVCFFLLDVNFPLLCDPEFRAGDPIMVTFLPLLFRNEILRKGFIVNSIVYCNSIIQIWLCDNFITSIPCSGIGSWFISI